MPTTITLKNVPDDVYDRLKTAAASHRRSINGQAIVCLDTALRAAPLSTADRLDSVRAIRASLPTRGFRARDIDSLKRRGRP